MIKTKLWISNFHNGIPEFESQLYFQSSFLNKYTLGCTTQKLERTWLWPIPALAIVGTLRNEPAYRRSFSASQTVNTFKRHTWLAIAFTDCIYDVRRRNSTQERRSDKQIIKVGTPLLCPCCPFQSLLQQLLHFNAYKLNSSLLAYYWLNSRLFLDPWTYDSMTWDWKKVGQIICMLIWIWKKNF